MKTLIVAMKAVTALVTKRIINRRNKSIKNKYLGLYINSVGKMYYSEAPNSNYFLRNKDRHTPVWNKKTKRKTDYEVLKNTW